MIEQQLKKLILLLNDGHYHTAQELAENLGISDKTVRTRLKEIQNEYGYCLNIESKAHKGFLLQVLEQELFEHEINTVKDPLFPENSEERVSYLIRRFAESKEWIKLDQLADEMFISKNSITHDIHTIETRLKHFNLTLERKPAYGIRLVGDEADKRKLVYNDYLYQNAGSFDNPLISQIAEILKNTSDKYGLVFSEANFQNIVMHLYISGSRIVNGFAMPEAVGEHLSVDPELERIVDELTDAITKITGISFNRGEKRYIAIHFMGKRNLHSNENEDNFVVSAKVIRLVNEMLEEVWETMKMDFRNNFDLQLRLYEHMVPLDIRLTYHLPIQNPLLELIKKEYTLAYMVAKNACVILNRHYDCQMTEDEISYIAILFGLAMDERNKDVAKKRMLLISEAGKMTRQLVAAQYRKTYGMYLETVDTCSPQELAEYDLDKVDVIFSTVPVSRPVKVPVVSISLSVKDNAEKVRETLRQKNVDYIDYYYREELFFKGVEAEDKENCIEKICQLTGEIVDLPAGFCESVKKREDLMPTFFGYRCALLHPYFMNTDISFAAVAVLKKPVIWGENSEGEEIPVRVVFLVSLAEGELYKIQSFYESISDFVVNADEVEELIRHPNLETLKELYAK